ncbi:MAG TPA: APC family permease [Blastocatellia bacterium]|nr:APC family permease [Blastocatellia bacterium]
MAKDRLAPQDAVKNQTQVRVVVATTVLLSFISFWRAAAIVLNDLGSSAYYVGGIAEHAVGRSAPWFILGVMLFSYAVRLVYVESCVMFTRGGVYRVVKQAMGGTLAKLSVSALMFDYILTGPISGVSAGQYIVGLVAQTATYFGHPWNPSPSTTNYLAAGIAILVTMYFWWRNTMGIHESSGDALRIMYVTTAMVIMLILWAGYSIITQPDKQRLPPAPVPHNLSFNRDAVGWLPAIAPGALRELSPETTSSTEPNHEETEPRLGIVANAGALLGLIGILIAFGHSFLAMSGEESLAQVNRELEHPKHKNLMRAGFVIFMYSLLFTSLVSFFAYSLIPDGARISYKDNLISGIAMYLTGPLPLKLLFQAFIVIVGCLMLSGAINTSIIGSNGVLNRVSEDGVMTDWFRAPHKKYGTTYRMINLIVLLQLLAIIASGGNTYALGEAYAFGVIWSFTFNGLAMLVLRFKDKSPREWKVPFNINLRDKELPLGLGIITVLLLSVAGINLITKEVATIAGVAFTIVFFIIFTVSERINQRKLDKSSASLDQFTLNYQPDVSLDSVGARPGSVLVAVRDYNTLSHLDQVLQRTDTEARDIIVMTARLMKGPDAGERDLFDTNLFTDYERRLFTRVVALAERHGKPVELVVVPTTNVFDAVAQTALRLDSAEIVAGLSSKMTAIEQARELGRGWERLPEKPRRQVWCRIVEPGNREHTVSLGAHAPQLTEDDVSLIHKIWLQVSQLPARRRVHHRDVVRVALDRLERELRGNTDVMLDFYKVERKGAQEPASDKDRNDVPSPGRTRL